MAYYPVEDYQEITAKTKPEMEQKIRALLPQGWYPVGDTLYLSKLSGNPTAYRQTMVKLTNTDSQFVASMYAVFEPKLDSLASQLLAISNQLSTTNSLLSQIEQHTRPVNPVSTTVSN